MDINSMDNMRYLKDEKHFQELAFQALKEHFKDKNELEQFYRSIKTDEDKNLFLKISSFYLYLVKNCSITHDIDGTVKDIEYITNTLKYIAIFSLIEGLYSNKDYIDFFEFLLKRSNQIQFPISERQLRGHYNNYKQQFGATRKAVAFFKQIEDLYDIRLKGKIKRLKDGWQLPVLSISKVDKEQGLTINDFAKFLYGIRSDFVHQANLVLEVSNGTVISFKKKYSCQMNMDELMYVFEKGLLKFFEAKNRPVAQPPAEETGGVKKLRRPEMRKLYLSRKYKKIFGVCGGIGEAYDIDPTLVRLIVVFLCLATGVAPLLLTYLAAWIIVPKKPSE